MKIIQIIFLLLSIECFSQNSKIDSIYIMYDKYRDVHHHQKNNLNSFDICVDNKYINFGYGTSVKNQKKKKLDVKITNREELATIIKNDKSSHRIIFFIITKVKNEYIIYPTDYRFRTIYDRDFYFGKE
ncbi:hypothetical protein [Paenimyroides ceti]